MKVSLHSALLGTTQPREMLSQNMGLFWGNPTSIASCHRCSGPNIEMPPPCSPDTSHLHYSDYKKIQCLIEALHCPCPPPKFPSGLSTWEDQGHMWTPTAWESKKFAFGFPALVVWTGVLWRPWNGMEVEQRRRWFSLQLRKLWIKIRVIFLWPPPESNLAVSYKYTGNNQVNVKNRGKVDRICDYYWKSLWLSIIINSRILERHCIKSSKLTWNTDWPEFVKLSLKEPPYMLFLISHQHFMPLSL